MCVSCRPHLLGQWRRQDAIRAIRGLTCQETQIPFVSPPANTRTDDARARRSKTRRISNLDLCAFDKNVINGLNLSFLQKKLLQDIICGTTQWCGIQILCYYGSCKCYDTERADKDLFLGLRRLLTSPAMGPP